MQVENIEEASLNSNKKKYTIHYVMMLLLNLSRFIRHFIVFVLLSLTIFPMIFSLQIKCLYYVRYQRVSSEDAV
jgi:hypothetical protein